MSKLRTVKVGIVGCGGIANGKHLPSLKICENVEMVAFCDIIIDRAEKAAKEYGVKGAKVFKDYKDLVAMKEIEVVHVLTPNYKHAEISIAALKAGKHVMCEKPMATSSAEAKAMCDAAKKSGKKLTIGYQSRSDANYQYARELIRSGKLGEIYYLRAPAIRRRGVPTWGVFMDEEKQGGGPMIDIGTHSIDAALWMIGNYDVASVTGVVNHKLKYYAQDNGSWGSWGDTPFTVEDSAMGFVRFKNGATMYVEASWLLNTTGSQHTTICGTLGGLELRGDGVMVNGERPDEKGEMKLFSELREPTDADREFFKDEKLSDSEYEARQWIQAIVNDTNPLVLPEEAAMVTNIIEAIYKSGKSGKTIYFE
ncbi:MAG TPA: Gfo/Idh/MocA family oxidoreductase [Clostridiales bacterium]|jgi:predicted dehydrogenase|nr:Gfo/Idh/MocA family oxidoreductase [Clostridiales bacterium]